MDQIALVSDIHGNILALEAVATDIQRRHIPRVINLGDHISGPLWPKETVDFLMNSDWIHILGNHDRHLVTQDPNSLGPSDAFAFQFLKENELSWLNTLPPLIKLDNDIVAFHGTPKNDEEYLLESICNRKVVLSDQETIKSKLDKATGNRIILCGHTHFQRCIQLDGFNTIINPGSVGLQGYVDDGMDPHVVEIGSPHARYAILNIVNQEVEVEFIALEYNWHKASDRAFTNKRKDWGNALLKGFIN
jgi:predicted phosphodiesterase